MIENGTVWLLFFLMPISGRTGSWLHAVGPVHLHLKRPWPVNPVVVREAQSPGPGQGCRAGSRSVWATDPLLGSRRVT